MAINSLAEIETEIASTRNELKNVHGTEAEVYARIVGYYRSVRNWNKGKRDEYNQRKLYDIDQQENNAKAKTLPSVPVDVVQTKTVKNEILEGSLFDNDSTNSSKLRYEFFSRKTCPNCPPVREYLTNIKDTVVNIDVDSEDGLARASELGVFAAPTVILFNGLTEVGRAHSTDELESLCKKTA
jgi:ribonucleoside-triphosphate reductase